MSHIENQPEHSIGFPQSAEASDKSQNENKETDSNYCKTHDMPIR